MSLLAVCVAGFCAGAAFSTEDFMNRLPNFERFRCAICHTMTDPVTGDASLNLFGSDFAMYGYEWDAELAAMDSDDDGVPNGVELGDNNGDGTTDHNFELSNPGDELDIPSSLPPDTWSVIKRLFGD